MNFSALLFAFAGAFVTVVPSQLFAQAASSAQATPPATQPRPATPAPAQPAQTPPVPATPPDYVIGPEDVLSIVYWKDKDMTTDVQVRPDGKISLALLNDIDAAGLTPEQLRVKLTDASKDLLEDFNITVIVKAINSRKVFIQGQVGKQGPYPLTQPTTVLQLISLAGGLGEYADSKNIGIIRTENGRQQFFKMNYKDVMSGKKLTQNIQLKPGDTVVVP